MNEIEFAEKLKADGYTEIETQNLEPRPAKGEHPSATKSAMPILHKTNHQSAAA